MAEVAELEIVLNTRRALSQAKLVDQALDRIDARARRSA